MNELQAAKEIMQVLINHGYDVYIVGGYVRDYLLGREGGDIDLATNARPEEVVSLFKRTVLTGVKHGTVTVLWGDYAFEVTTFRKEGKYLDHRRPENVDYVDSFQEDVKRRDFTMNALGLAIDGTIVDYVGGEDDIRHRRIQTVGDPYKRMEEDALRMLRAFRFAASLDFSIHPDTLTAIKELGSLMNHISLERIIEELKKLIQGQAFIKSLHLMAETKFFRHLGFFEQGLNICLEKMYQPNTFSEFLAMCFITGDAKKFSQLPLSNALVKETKQIVQFYREGSSINPWTIFTYGKDVALATNRIDHVLNGQALKTKEIKQISNELPIHGIQDLAITGNDLMTWFNKKGGPWIKAHLLEVAQRIVLGKLENDYDAIRQYLLKKD